MPTAHLENNFLHLLIRCLELPLQHNHHLTGVVERMLSIHEGDNVANALEEGG